MKKLILIAPALVMGVILFSSCKKDYNCTCTTVDMSPTPIDPVSDTHVITAKESEAKTSCESGSYAVNNFVTTCVIN